MQLSRGNGTSESLLLGKSYPSKIPSREVGLLIVQLEVMAPKNRCNSRDGVHPSGFKTTPIPYSMDDDITPTTRNHSKPSPPPFSSYINKNLTPSSYTPRLRPGPTIRALLASQLLPKLSKHPSTMWMVSSRTYHLPIILYHSPPPISPTTEPSLRSCNPRSPLPVLRPHGLSILR